MKLVHPFLETLIDFAKSTTWFLIIENNKEYYNFCLDFFSLSQGESGNFCLSKNNEIINFAKSAILLYDFLNFDFSSKKIKSILEGAVLEELNKSEYIVDLSKLNSQIVLLNKRVTSQIDLPIDFTDEITVEKLMKISDFYIQTEQSLLEKIVTYIDLFIKIKKIKLVVFVGLLSYISEKELKDLILQFEYMQIKVLFLENRDYKVGSYPKIIVDKDLCEI